MKMNFFAISLLAVCTNIISSCGISDNSSQATLASGSDSGVTMVLLDGLDPTQIDTDDCTQLGLTGKLECRVKDEIISWTTRVTGVAAGASLFCTVTGQPLLALTARVVGGTSATLGFAVDLLPCQETFSPEQIKQIEEIVRKQLPPDAINQSLLIPNKPRR